MINKAEVGRRFEAESFKFLKQKFDRVVWNSVRLNYAETIDFTCYKGKKRYLIDAKGGKSKIKSLTEDQASRCDFVITKIKDKMRLISKRYFNKYFSLTKQGKMIPVSVKIFQRLNFAKMELKEKSYNKLLDRLLKNSKLKNEMEQSK